MYSVWVGYKAGYEGTEYEVERVQERSQGRISLFETVSILSL